MSRKYKFHNPQGIYLVTFATVNWIDVFTRCEYKDILISSINYCVEQKGLNVYAWVIMSNHVHMLVNTSQEPLEDIFRDLKHFTANSILKAIAENPQESRKAWLLWLFEQAGNKNSNNTKYQFWQQHNQPEELTKAFEMEQATDYIHNNPVKAGFVDKAEHYPYSSAVDYSGQIGLVKLAAM